MAVVFDKPFPATFRGRRIHVCHLMSDIEGNAGRAELLAIANEIGLKPQWLQKRNTPYEHFDLMGRKIEAARIAGAKQVSRNYTVEIIRRKKHG